MEEIGIQGEHIQERFDDALFCEQIERDALMLYLHKAGIAPDKPYVAANPHDWGQSPGTRELLVLRMAELCDDIVTKHHLQILFVPMVKSDERTITDCMAGMKQPTSLLISNYDYRVVRAAIASAQLCFTLKHHPIIFAMANAVPTIAVAVDDYYLHKNRGALALFKMEEWVLDQRAIFSSEADELISRILAEGACLSEIIHGQRNAHSSSSLSSSSELSL